MLNGIELTFISDIKSELIFTSQ